MPPRAAGSASSQLEPVTTTRYGDSVTGMLITSATWRACPPRAVPPGLVWRDVVAGHPARGGRPAEEGLENGGELLGGQVQPFAGRSALCACQSGHVRSVASSATEVYDVGVLGASHATTVCGRSSRVPARRLGGRCRDCGSDSRGERTFRSQTCRIRCRNRGRTPRGGGGGASRRPRGCACRSPRCR